MIFEYLLLEVVTNLLSSDKEKQVFYYYTLKNLNRLQIVSYNPHVKSFIDQVLSHLIYHRS